MGSLAHESCSSSRIRLTAEEREVIVTYNDAARCWHVYSDSATMRGTILKLARRIGADVRTVGTHGVEFEAPQHTFRLTPRRRGGGKPFPPGRTRKSPRVHAAPEGKVALLARS